MHEELTEIEDLCKKLTEKTFDRGLWAEYEVARERVFTKLLPHIKQNEPFLTDHGPDHITHVMRNAFALLGKDQCAGRDSKRSLEPSELYFLVLAILFHDVGNVFTRKGHKSRLLEAYEFAKGTDQSLAQERRLLFNIVEAHGGLTAQGSSDTIAPLDSSGIFRAKRVDCQRVAAILRLADELAEGRERTSLFMQKHLSISEESKIFHDYANITDVHISRDEGRIVVVYDIEMLPKTWGPDFDGARLRNLLEFCLFRIQKLDLERKYNRHYCSFLQRFKKTEATFNFHYNSEDLHIEIPTIVLDDLVMPDRFDPDRLSLSFPAFQLNTLMPRLEKAVEDLKARKTQEHAHHEN